MALCFIEPELFTSKDCGNRHFYLFCSCNLDLDLMTFIYDLDPYSLGISGLEKIMIFLKNQKKSDFFDLNQIFLI